MTLINVPDFKIKKLEKQRSLLQTFFPGLGEFNPDFLLAIKRKRIALPNGAAGWFAIPNWQKNLQCFGDNYMKALRRVFGAMARVFGQSFMNFYIDRSNNFFGPTTRTSNFLRKIIESQDNPEILIIPGDLWNKNRSWQSVCDVRTSILKSNNEFGLDAFSVGTILLTHLDRVPRRLEWKISCPGERVRDTLFDGKASYSNLAPTFHFSRGEIIVNKEMTGNTGSKINCGIGFVF